MEKAVTDSSRSLRALVVATVIALVAIGGFLAYGLAQSHRRYADATADNLENLTLNLERYLATRLQSADLALTLAADEFKRLGPQGLQQPEEFTATLRTLQKRMPDQPDIRAADRAGRVVWGVLADARAPVSVAQRHFFIEAITSDGLVIGLPLKSRLTQRWVLPLARQLRDAAGNPAGVVYLALELGPLDALFRALNTGPQGAVTLFNTHREVLLRVPSLPPSQDERPPRLASPETLAALASGKTTALVTTRSSLDQQVRTLMFRRIDHFPAYILVGLGREDMLAPWHRECAQAAAFWIGLAAAAALLLLQQRRSALAAERAMRRLGEAQRLAEAGNEAKGQFLANMSHEVRTPLNGVLGFAQLGAGDDAASPESRRMFSRILEAGRLLEALLNDVLDMAQMQGGTVPLRPELTALRPVLRHAVELHEDTASRKGLALSLTVDMAVPDSAVIDGMRLRQIVTHLLSNAVKFTDAGCVEVSLEATGGDLLLTVADTGIGLTDAQQARLFIPFEVGDATSTRRFGGSGLGLALTHRLVQRMGGQLSVASRPGAGATFRVRLPLARPDDAPDPAPASADTATQQSFG